MEVKELKIFKKMRVDHAIPKLDVPWIVQKYQPTELLCLDHLRRWSSSEDKTVWSRVQWLSVATPRETTETTTLRPGFPQLLHWVSAWCTRERWFADLGPRARVWIAMFEHAFWNQKVLHVHAAAAAQLRAPHLSKIPMLAIGTPGAWLISGRYVGVRWQINHETNRAENTDKHKV